MKIFVPWVAGGDAVWEAVCDGDGRNFCEDSGTGITGADSGVPDFLVAGKVGIGLVWFGFDFLETEDVGVVKLYKVLEVTFFQDGS